MIPKIRGIEYYFLTLGEIRGIRIFFESQNSEKRNGTPFLSPKTKGYFWESSLLLPLILGLGVEVNIHFLKSKVYSLKTHLYNKD